MQQPADVRTERLAVGAALVTVVLWASAFVGIRAAAVDLSAGSIAVGRLAVGALALGLLVVTRPWVRPSRRAVACIVAAGLLWFGAYNVVLNEAERLVDAGTAAMLVGIGPIFIALFAGLFLGEGFPRRLLLGCAVAFAGTAIIGLATSVDAGATTSTPLGIVLCIAAALLYAAGVTFQKPALRTVPGLEVTWLACAVGLIACLPFLPTLAGEIGQASPESLAWVVYLGIFPTAIGFSTWAYALARMNAGRAGMLTYLIPPTAIGISWALLGEAPAALAVLGGALCIAGVVVARSTRQPQLSALRRRSADADSPEPA